MSNFLVRLLIFFALFQRHSLPAVTSRYLTLLLRHNCVISRWKKVPYLCIANQMKHVWLAVPFSSVGTPNLRPMHTGACTDE